ncbi:MAG: DNA replication and repair protein RecF [Rikenellaceae bacterium]
MLLKRLSLINFKNIAQAELNFESGINAFVGDNGTGKTNILDAIYYLSMCKSMFSTTDGQSVRHGADFFVADGLYSTSEERTEAVVCTFSKQRTHIKSLKRNGKVYERLSDHVGLIPVVVVSPQDSALISLSADERRKFLNGFLSQLDSAYLSSLIKYNALIVQRNKVLKSGADEAMLAIYDAQLTPHAEYIYQCRNNIIDKIGVMVEEFYAVLSSERESVSLEYRSELAKGNYTELMQASRQRDIINEHTTSGVHRDDVIFSIGEYPLRKYGSQGQQKTFLVALKLAQYMLLETCRDEKPILLLDDLFDKLDAGRVEQLIHLVSGDEFGQIFITDCNRTRLQRILNEMNCRYKLFEMEDGKANEKCEV